MCPALGLVLKIHDSSLAAQVAHETNGYGSVTAVAVIQWSAAAQSDDRLFSNEDNFSLCRYDENVARLVNG